MLSQFLQFVFSGVTVGATYALAALGFSIIYNASGVINFAQGEFIMLGGMLAVMFTQADEINAGLVGKHRLVKDFAQHAVHALRLATGADRDVAESVEAKGNGGHGKLLPGQGRG